MLEPKLPHKEPVDVPCGIDGDVQPCVVEEAVVITLICQRTVGASLVVDRFLWVREGLERLNGSPISRGQGCLSSSRGGEGGGGAVEVLCLSRRLLVLLSSICNQRKTPKMVKC